MGTVLGGPGGRGDRRRFWLNLQYEYAHNPRTAANPGVNSRKLREAMFNWGVVKETDQEVSFLLRTPRETIYRQLEGSCW